MVLAMRAAQRMWEVAPSVRARALADDITLHWTSSNLSSCVELRRATAQYIADMAQLRIAVQPDKSGYVATRAGSASAFALHGSALKFQPKKWVRNLGHDLHGVRPVRKLERQRLSIMAGKAKRLQMLRRTVGANVGQIWRTSEIFLNQKSRI